MDALPLVPRDLPRLYREYFYARAQWYAVGCALGVGADDLEAIDRNHRGRCEDCFREVLLKWLRNQGRKTEPELVQVIIDVTPEDGGDKDNIVTEPDTGLFPRSLCTTIVILLGIVSAIPAVHVYRAFTASSFTTAARDLKGQYKLLPVVEFELLDFTANMPYINVTVLSTSATDFWELLNRIDSKHMQLQATDQPGELERILITGHPGAGKTTLMRHLAKEWANGTKLQSCKVLFLIQFGRLSKDQKPQYLGDLLQLSPYKYLDLKGLSEEIQQRQGAGACFLLDSYDEWIWRKDFIHQLFFEFNLHSSLCILTSRPSSDTKFMKQPGIKFIQMTGFKISDLEKHLQTLSTDSHVTNSIIRLWNSNHFIKEMCTLPLNMMMLLSITKNEERLVLNTRTEIYSAFMNVTVKHFSDSHPSWNTVSLWECILNVSDSHSDKLCIAFKELHRVAFEMFFNRAEKFPDCQEINSNMNKLGFVNVTKVDSSGDEVKYTFYHPTFQEFFAAIHLLSLKREELLYLLIKERQKRIWERNNPWLFYFGLIGAHYSEENVSAILKQLSMYRRMWESCTPFCYDRTTFKYIQEIGWTGEKLDELLESAGIVVNSTTYVDFDLDSITLGYILNHTTIHKLRLEDVWGYDTHLYLEDNNLKAISCAQLESLKSCLRVSLSERLTPLAVPMLTHLHFKLHWPSFNTIVCLLEAATNLYSLQIHLKDDIATPAYFFSERVHYSNPSRSLALTSILNLGQRLQTLSLAFGPLYCGDLSPYISFLKNISSKYRIIRDLEIEIQQPQHHLLMTCVLQLTLLFNKVKHLDKLQKLTLRGPNKLPLLGHSIGALRDICGQNELQTLEVRKVGASEVQMLSWYFSNTLQELNLCENDISDYDIDLIAQGLRHLQDLKSLSLCKNSITGGSLTTLVEALKSQRNFFSLDLSNNPISDSDGIKALGELRNLRELKLTASEVNIKELVNLLLSNNITLDSLSISWNKSIGMSSLQPLAQLTDLHHLDISEAEIKTSHDTNMLVEILKKLNKLESFKLCNHITVRSRWTIDLARVISHHLPHLRTFHAPCLEIV